MAADPDLSETSQCLCLASRKAARAITRAFEKELRPRGLRATQFSALAILELRGPQTIGALAGTLGTERTTLTRNLAVLEQRALIRIDAGEDARVRLAAITAQGRAALMRALPAWHKVQSALTASVGRPMVDNLRRLARSAQV
jgi:DNA-binding MarR family transcriptional regulator